MAVAAKQQSTPELSEEANGTSEEEAINNSNSVSSIMSTNILTVTLHQSVQEIIKILHEKHITGLPVMDDNKNVIGVVSSLDVIVAAGMGKMDLKLGQLPIKLSAKKDVLHVNANDPIKDALILIVKHKIGRLLVMDEQDKLLGIVTRKDLLKYFAEAA